MVVEVVQVMYGIATQIAMVLVTKILYFFIEFRISWKESYSVLVKKCWIVLLLLIVIVLVEIITVLVIALVLVKIIVKVVILV